MPAVLLAFFWPIDPPTLDDLATPGEPVVIQALLLAVVWACWGLFTASVAVELAGVIRIGRAGHAYRSSGSPPT